mgnify:FL=1
MSVTITAKIPKELKEKIRRLNINASRVIREALEAEVRRREEERLKALAREVSRILNKIPKEEIVRTIREARDER